MRGALLINLGTPQAPDPTNVRRYLKEFLSDPRVLDIGAIGRWALLNLIILPTRPKASAHAYSKIWTDRGSPLLFHSQDLTTKVAARLGPEWKVELAMRYGRPSIANGLAALRDAGVDQIVLFPLYPQYSSAATGSSLEEAYGIAAREWNVPPLATVPAFYDHPGFIAAFAERGRVVIDREKPDHVIFSYHGLPERHVKRSDSTGTHCLAQASCCDRMVTANANCYRAQCFATTRALVAALGLNAQDTSVTFQSRLGRTPWIRPYTDIVIPELARAGKKRLVVFSPAFVADCLETLEEIALQAQELFIEAGGEQLTLVPSLNAEDSWADAVTQLVKQAAGEA